MIYRGHVWEARFTDPNVGKRGSNKFYRIYIISDEVDDHRVLFNWGRWGSTGQFSVVTCSTRGASDVLATDKLVSKLAKGYEAIRNEELEVIPDDVLERAAISANARSEAKAKAETDPFAAVMVDTDRLVRMITGPAELTAEAVVLRSTLADKLGALRERLADVEGRFELATDIMTMK